MSFRGSFVVGTSFEEECPNGMRLTNQNQDYEDVPVVLDIEEYNDDDQQDEVNFMLDNNDNFQGVIDPHRSAAFGFRTSITGSMKADLQTPIKGIGLSESAKRRKTPFIQTFGEPEIIQQPIFQEDYSNLERSNEIIASEDDFIFIQEVLQQAAAELRQKEHLPQSLHHILEMQDMDDINSALNTITQDLTAQQQEFQRVIEFGGFLIDQARKSRQEAEDAQQILEDKSREIFQLQEREACILTDWKHEQKCTRELEATLDKRDAAFQKLQDQNSRQRATIDQMAIENERLIENINQIKATPKNQISTPNAQESKQKSKFDFSQEKLDQQIQEMEELLLQKCNELEEVEKQNEINLQRIQQTVELNEQLYFDIDEANQALIDQEQKILELESMNKQLVQECHRLESLTQQQPNKMLQMLKAHGQLSIDDGTSQRTQSFYGNNMTQSQRAFDQSQNDDTLSKNSNQVYNKRKTAVQGKKPIEILSQSTQFQKLANAQRFEGTPKSNKNSGELTQQGVKNAIMTQSLQTLPGHSLTFKKPALQRPANVMQIEVGDDQSDDLPEYQVEVSPQQFEYDQPELGPVDQEMRESQLMHSQYHFENQDEIYPGEVHYEEVVVNDLAGLEDQDGLPADHFSNFDYSKRPSYLMSSRISGMPLDDRTHHQTNLISEHPVVQVPISQRLKERQDQIRRIIETTDLIEGQNYFEELRKTFNTGRQSVLVVSPLPTGPGTPRIYQDAPKTSKAPQSNQPKKFDFSSKAVKQEPPSAVVNNTYITNHYNNFPLTPTQSMKINEETVQTPQQQNRTLSNTPNNKKSDLTEHPSQNKNMMQSVTVNKKVDLIDLDHYQPSKPKQQLSLGQNGSIQSGFAETTRQSNSSVKLQVANTRASYARMSESMLNVMPIIIEEDFDEQVQAKQSLKVVTTSGRAAVGNLEIQTKEGQNIENRISTDSLMFNKSIPSPSSQSIASSETGRRRSVAIRKEPEEEFFSMTLVSQIMCHQKKNLIISLQSDSSKLFRICQKNNKAFFEWPSWIANYLEAELKKMKELSLNKAQRFGAKKIATQSSK